MNKSYFSDILKTKGLKSTHHRIEMLNIIEKSSQPIAAEQIFREMQISGITINLSTVYRILDALCNKNLITKLNIDGDNRTLFEFNRMIHTHHLVCLGCKKILSIGCCPLEEYEKALAQDMNYDIAGHKLDIYGYCPACKQKVKQRGTRYECKVK